MARWVREWMESAEGWVKAVPLCRYSIQPGVRLSTRHYRIREYGRSRIIRALASPRDGDGFPKLSDRNVLYENKCSVTVIPAATAEVDGAARIGMSGGYLTLFRFKACTKCGGDLALDEGDWLCLQCGKYYYEGLYRDRDRLRVRWQFPRSGGFQTKGCNRGSRCGSGQATPVVFKTRINSL